MVLQIYNSHGQIDIGQIDPAAVATMSEPQQMALSVLIDAVKAREAAHARYSLAIKTADAARIEQSEALAAHIEAQQPFPFVAPKAENYGTKAAHDAAVREAREAHDLRVREHREIEARKASIAAFNNSLSNEVFHGYR